MEKNALQTNIDSEIQRMSPYEDNIRDIYHLFSYGDLAPRLLMNDTEFIIVMNIIPRTLLKNRCKLLAFALMNTHVHFAINGKHNDVENFAHIFKNEIIRSLPLKEKGLTSDNIIFDMKRLETVREVLTCISYIHRNPLEINKLLSPWHYRWCSANLVFANYEQLKSEGRVLSAFSIKAQREIFRTKFIYPQEWHIDNNGMILPVYYYDYALVNLLFKTAKAAISFLHIKRMDEEMINMSIAHSVITSTSDKQLEDSAKKLAVEYFDKQFIELSIEEQAAIAQILKRNHSAEQIHRVLALKKEIIKRL